MLLLRLVVLLPDVPTWSDIEPPFSGLSTGCDYTIEA